MTLRSYNKSFAEFLHAVNARPESDRATAIDEFMSSLTSAPYIEKNTLAHFVYRGEAESIAVPSDANDWNSSGFPMKNLKGTNFWYRTQVFEPDARLDYKFVLNGSTWILDPLNPYQSRGGFGPNSELRMPKYSPPADVEYHHEIAHGTLSEVIAHSEVLGNTRTITVYTPYGYECSKERYPVVLFQDGTDFLSLGCANNTLDYLIARKRLVPVLAVFVPPIDRNSEYAGAQMGAFYSFVVDELLPVIDHHFRTKQDPSDRASIGASNGGNISLWLGLNYPEVFGNIAALSSNVVSTVFNGYENSPRLNLKFYLDVGTYDLEQLIPLVKNFVALIHSKGYPYLYWKHHGGHSWGSWRANLGRVLSYFFPPRTKGMINRRTRERSNFVQNTNRLTSPLSSVSL